MKLVLLLHDWGSGEVAEYDGMTKTLLRWAKKAVHGHGAAPLVLPSCYKEFGWVRFLTIGYEYVHRSDEVWLVGPHISSDMEVLAAKAWSSGKKVFDLTAERLGAGGEVPMRFDTKRTEKLYLWKP